MSTKPEKYRVVPNEDLAFMGTGPVPAGPYYRDDYFELEREAIFRRVWLQIGHVCELPRPGCFIVRPIEVLKASVLITHGDDGRIRAFHNICTHRGTKLVYEESGKQAAFSCPYHMWTFGNDGKLNFIPDADKFYDIDQCKLGLPEIALDICGGLIFVNLDKSPRQSLREYLGPVAAKIEAQSTISRATTFAEYTYEVEANWKMVVDNYQENYHLRYIHPRTGGATSAPENPFGYPTRFDFYGPHRSQNIWSNPAGADAFKPMQRFALSKVIEAVKAEGRDLTGSAYLGIFPNLAVVVTSMTTFVHTMMPLAAGRTRGAFRLYCSGEDRNASARFAREYGLAGILDVHCEDRHVLRAGHEGLASGAIEYMYFQSQEVLCRHLFNTANDMVEAYKAEQKTAGRQ